MSARILTHDMRRSQVNLVVFTGAVVIVLCCIRLFLCSHEFSQGKGIVSKDTYVVGRNFVKYEGVKQFGNERQYQDGRTSFVTRVPFAWDPYATTRPAPDSLFWKLWKSSFWVASQALSSRFVEGVRTGTLSKKDYTVWSQSDSYYCAQSASFYKLASDRAYGLNDYALGRFLQKKHEWYKAYNEVFYEGVDDSNRNESQVIPSPVMPVPSRVILEYVSFQHWVVLKFHPVYTLIVMLPCEWLWAWLTQMLITEVDSSNEFLPWIRYNTDATPAFASANFIDSFMMSHGDIIFPSVADELYRTATAFEIDNFNDI